MQPGMPATIASAGATCDLSRETIHFLRQHVHRTTGIVLDEGKDYLLDARLRPLLAEMKFLSFERLCGALLKESDGMVNRRLVDAITTNETLFFRDLTTFEALRSTILPELLEKARDRKLKIWSAAASSGQEAYSIAMMLLEAGVAPGRVEILGTDISDEILEKARLGKYAQFEVNRGLPSSLLMKYFHRAGLAWQLRDDVRSMVSFRQADLRRIGASGFTFDLVLCRNVLIYFDPTTKQQILGNLHASLLPHGILVLGCAETLLNSEVPLCRRVVGQASFYTR